MRETNEWNQIIGKLNRKRFMPQQAQASKKKPKAEVESEQIVELKREVGKLLTVIPECQKED